MGQPNEELVLRVCVPISGNERQWLDFDLPFNRNICATVSINIPDVGLHLSIRYDDDLIMNRQNQQEARIAISQYCSGN